MPDPTLNDAVNDMLDKINEEAKTARPKLEAKLVGLDPETLDLARRALAIVEGEIERAKKARESFTTERPTGGTEDGSDISFVEDHLKTVERFAAMHRHAKRTEIALALFVRQSHSRCDPRGAFAAADAFLDYEKQERDSIEARFAPKAEAPKA